MKYRRYVVLILDPGWIAEDGKKMEFDADIIFAQQSSLLAPTPPSHLVPQAKSGRCTRGSPYIYLSDGRPSNGPVPKRRAAESRTIDREVPKGDIVRRRETEPCRRRGSSAPPPWPWDGPSSSEARAPTTSRRKAAPRASSAGGRGDTSARPTSPSRLRPRVLLPTGGTTTGGTTTGTAIPVSRRRAAPPERTNERPPHRDTLPPIFRFAYGVRRRARRRRPI